MKYRSHAAWFTLFFLTALALPTAAQPARKATWGLRAGVSSDPDQVVLGAQVNLGQLLDSLYFRPSLDLGSGDDLDSASLFAPLIYRSKPTPGSRAYLGIGPFVNLQEPDDGSGSESEFGFGAVLGGALVLTSDREIFLEVNVGGGDSFDYKVMLGIDF